MRRYQCIMLGSGTEAGKGIKKHLSKNKMSRKKTLDICKFSLKMKVTVRSSSRVNDPVPQRTIAGRERR